MTRPVWRGSALRRDMRVGSWGAGGAGELVSWRRCRRAEPHSNRRDGELERLQGKVADFGPAARGDRAGPRGRGKRHELGPARLEAEPGHVEGIARSEERRG